VDTWKPSWAAGRSDTAGGTTVMMARLPRIISGATCVQVGQEAHQDPGDARSGRIGGRSGLPARLPCGKTPFGQGLSGTGPDRRNCAAAPL
jgi:hypothetical protein